MFANIGGRFCSQSLPFGSLGRDALGWGIEYLPSEKNKLRFNLEIQYPPDTVTDVELAK